MAVPDIEWFKALCEDADHARVGFQASWLYVAWNVFSPAAFGAAIALLVGLLRKIVAKASERKSD